jgi:hypothetical protein
MILLVFRHGLRAAKARDFGLVGSNSLERCCTSAAPKTAPRVPTRKTAVGTLVPLKLGLGRPINFLLREPKDLERLAEAPERMAAQRP